MDLPELRSVGGDESRDVALKESFERKKHRFEEIWGDTLGEEPSFKCGWAGSIETETVLWKIGN